MRLSFAAAVLLLGCGGGAPITFDVLAPTGDAGQTAAAVRPTGSGDDAASPSVDDARAPTPRDSSEDAGAMPQPAPTSAPTVAPTAMASPTATAPTQEPPEASAPPDPMYPPAPAASGCINGVKTQGGGASPNLTPGDKKSGCSLSGVEFPTCGAGYPCAVDQGGICVFSWAC